MGRGVVLPTPERVEVLFSEASSHPGVWFGYQMEKCRG